jgi:NAD(P)-dependent dehydrogenase (short-subunit alcohol dehydrogenase family)
MEIKGKVAVVTGAAHRVGKAVALALAGRGAHLVVHYHAHAALAAETAREIEALGTRAVAVGADLGTPAGVAALFDAVEQEFGGVDILVNSAAIMEAGELLTTTWADWQRTLDLNLAGPFFCAQRAARSMLARGGGVILNISDLAALQPWVRYPAHSASKAGLNMLTAVLARALAPTIRVNGIAPGPVAKPQGWGDARWEAIGRRTLLKHNGSGYDVAQAALFLIEHDFITGETLVVDGGARYA